MKLRFFAAAVVCFALTTVAAHAQATTQTDTPTVVNQVGVYINPVATRISNSIADNGPFAFLGQNSKSNVFYGVVFGGYDDFYHTGKLDIGIDIRDSAEFANNASLKALLFGVRVSGHPFVRPFRPYAQLSIGVASTKAPNSSVVVRGVDYGLFAGMDYALGRHVDLRMLEIGYGGMTTVSSNKVGSGGTVAIPVSNMLNFSSGLVFRF